MRAILVGLAAILWVCFAGSAQAEWHMFIIANDGDGYGIDRCLASGDKCGAAAANSYCKHHEFASASAYRKIERGGVTGSIPTSGSGACKDGKCDVVAIVCTR